MNVSEEFSKSGRSCIGIKSVAAYFEWCGKRCIRIELQLVWNGVNCSLVQNRIAAGVEWNQLQL